MKKVFYIICFSALLLPTLVWAGDGTDYPHHGPNAAVRKYIKEQVMPVLIQKRQQFDRELSIAEKNEIAECKAALKQLRGEHHDWKKPEQNTTTQDNTYYGEAQKGSPEFEQRKAIMERLKAIAEKHSNSLQDIKTQLEPTVKQWVSDIKRLMPAPTGDDKAAAVAPQRGHREGMLEGFMHHHHIAARFLLLPTSTAAVDQPQGELKSDFTAPGSNVTAPNAAGITSFSVMPNPTNNDLQLGNDILPATNTLKVIDMQGKEVLTLENVQPAQHLNVSQLANGTYLVQIKSGDQTVSKKVVINR